MSEGFSVPRQRLFERASCRCHEVNTVTRITYLFAGALRMMVYARLVKRS